MGAIAVRASHAAIQRDAFNIVRLEADDHKQRLVSDLRRSRASLAAFLGAIKEQCGVRGSASQNCLQYRLVQYVAIRRAVGAQLRVPGLAQITAGAFPLQLTPVHGRLCPVSSWSRNLGYQIEVSGTAGGRGGNSASGTQRIRCGVKTRVGPECKASRRRPFGRPRRRLLTPRAYSAFLVLRSCKHGADAAMSPRVMAVRQKMSAASPVIRERGVSDSFLGDSGMHRGAHQYDGGV